MVYLLYNNIILVNSRITQIWNTKRQLVIYSFEIHINSTYTYRAKRASCCWKKFMKVTKSFGKFPYKS